MNWLVPREARLLNVREETKDVSTFLFELIDGAGFFFRPGQFNMVGFAGIGEAPISFSSLPQDNRFEHTIRFVGNVTHAIRKLSLGMSVQIRGPYGNGWPMELVDERDVVLMAGGIGMAPLRPVVHELLGKQTRAGKLFLLYGARTYDDLLFKDELEMWKESGKVQVLVSVDEPPGARRAIVDRVGVVTALLEEIDVDFENSVFFVCGPEIMMRFAARSAMLKGASLANVYVSLERRMFCGFGHCGHCQIGAKYVCKDGPVFRYRDIARYPDTLL